MGVVALLLVSWACFALVSCNSVQIQLSYGTVVGSYTQDGPLTFTRINRFLGIPYAKVPTGNLRFKPPEEHAGWSSYDATSYGPPCLQATSSGVIGDEDCLHLNIYIPGEIVATPADPLPVMVYIHGGDFVSGNAQDHQGDQLLNYVDDANVILVTFNYRLGIFGFISSGDNVIPGNMGLQDQAFAIEWVRDNIAYFGGDNTNITIFGQSSGGACVKAHIVSPVTSGMFHRAIVQSGLSTWKFPSKSFHMMPFIAFGEDLNCQGDSTGILACLQSKDASAILSASQSYMFYTPLIDGEFLSENPEDYLASGTFTNLDILVGFNSDDGTAWFKNLAPALVNGFLFAGIPSGDANLDTAFGFCVHLAVSELGALYNLTFVYATEQEKITNIDDLLKMVKDRYIPSDANGINNGRKLLDAVRDCAYMTHSLQLAAKVASDGGRAYVYYFDHRSSTTTLGDIAPSGVQIRAPHGEELPYVFGQAIDSSFTNGERILSQSMIRAWVTFAKSGEPYYHDLGFNAQPWPAYTEAEKNILVFDMSGLSSGNNPIQEIGNTWYDVMQFWMSVRDTVEYEPEDETEGPETRALRESDEEFETEYLKLDKFEADIAIIMLAIAAFLLLLLTIALACKICCTDKKGASGEKYAY